LSPSIFTPGQLRRKNVASSQEVICEQPTSRAAKFQAEETKKWGRVIKAAGIEPE
jgi:hypothetical protein